MSRFKRVAKAQARREGEERAAKRVRRDIIVATRRSLDLGGARSQKVENYLLNIGKVIEQGGGTVQDVPGLIQEWKRQDPRGARSSPQDKPMKFFYFVRDHRLNGPDKLVFVAYDLVARDYLKEVNLPASYFKNAGQITERLRVWLGDAGNDPETVLIDYLKAVFNTCKKFETGVIRKPDTCLGEWGWGAWLEYVDKLPPNGYGGKHMYLLPNDQEVTEAKRLNKVHVQVEQIRAGYLRAGDVATYDKIGMRAAQGEKELYAILEEFGG